MASCVEENKQKDHAFLEDLEESMARGERTIDPLAKLLHMEILWADPHEAEGILYVTPDILNPYGSVHGGCLVTLADTVAGHNMAAAGKLCVTLSSTVNFLKPATGRLVHCHSHIQKLGKRVSVVAVEASDEHETLLLSALFTFSAMKSIPPHLISARDEADTVQT